MSAKTKIVVLHKKNLIYIGFVFFLCILFLFILLFLSHHEKNSAAESDVATASASIYTPGLYSSEMILGGEVISLEISVDANHISSMHLCNLTDTVATMYPLLQPTFDSLCNQIYETQTLENIQYNTDNKYTSFVLLDAIKSALNKAALQKNEVLPQYLQ